MAMRTHFFYSFLLFPYWSPNSSFHLRSLAVYNCARLGVFYSMMTPTSPKGPSGWAGVPAWEMHCPPFLSPGPKVVMRGQEE